MIKAVASEAADGAARPAAIAEAATAPPVPEAPPEKTTASNTGNGSAAAAPSWQPRPTIAAPANGDQRRTLHLSLGAPGHADGAARTGEPAAAEQSGAANRAPSAAPAAALPGNGTAPASGHDDRRHGEPPQPNGGDGAHRRNGAFIDHELRARVEGDITAFLAAFDAALDEDTPESRSALREATDRLLRAGARTRIELERLEARLPLAAREAAGRSNPAWRR
ncbi:MAG TPA: hypothetical protein VMF86_13670 [Stellaceae bacterium]|nr:hypothetical protein [Stellaceae bacterium]